MTALFYYNCALALCLFAAPLNSDGGWPTGAVNENGGHPMYADLLTQGVELMLLGMGIVFGFLGVLVFTLRGMSLLADRLHPPQPLQPASPQPIDVSDHRRVVAVITAAVARYRASRAA